MAEADRLAEQVGEVLRQHVDGATLVHREPAGLLVAAGNQRFVLVAKRVTQRRIDEVLGALARAVLEARSASGVLNSAPVAAVIVTKLGDRMAAKAAEFMGNHAPDVGWLLVDRYGGVRLELPALAVSVDQPSAPPAEPPLEQPGLFTDLHQWLLKILLLRNAPESYWAGPRPRLSSAPELALVGRVSVRKAYQFVEALERHGFLRRHHRQLLLVRRAALFEAWFSHQRLQPPRLWPVRWLFGPVEDLNQILARREAEQPSFVIGGFEACRRLGLLRVPAARPEVHVLAAPEQLLQGWDLERCELRDAALGLVMCATPKSVQRGALDMNDLPVVDPIQAALDVVVHEARGHEQAEYLRDLVLSWQEEQ